MGQDDCIAAALGPARSSRTGACLGQAPPAEPPTARRRIAGRRGGRRKPEEPSSPPRSDKSGYSLFNPTPRELMRELEPDRPDVTEGPGTVDAGHLQVEFSFVEWGEDRRREDQTTHSLSILPLMLRVGVTDRTEIDLSFVPHDREHTVDHATGEETTAEGFGDMELRAKINFFGNEGDGPALGIIPYLRIPSATDGLGSGYVEGGGILAFSTDLPAGFDLSAMIQVDVRRTDGNDRYTADVVHSASVGHEIAGGVGAFVEYVGLASVSHDEEYRGYFNTGLTWKASENVQFDASVQIGLTRGANDLGLFAGMTMRFLGASTQPLPHAIVQEHRRGFPKIAAEQMGEMERPGSRGD